MKEAVYVFSGQGAQSVGMGQDLCESSPAASIIFEKADAALGWSISDICFNGPEEKLKESRYCQPAIYTMSAACIAAFNEKYTDSRALATAGLSLGEFAALCVAGVFDFEDGLKLIEKRGQLMDEACRETNGGMASVLGGNGEIIKEVCEECGIDVANYNSPGQIVISGEKEKVTDAIKVLKEKGLRKIIPLRVAGAYHSRMMQSAADKFKDVIADVKLNTPVIPVAQNFTGTFTKDVEEIRTNLVKQVAGSVLWEDCVHTLVGTGATQVIEFGPGNVLTGLVRRTVGHVATANVNSTESLENFK
jgi:[acyl-carrier-protein] S-malonyltransferase